MTAPSPSPWLHRLAILTACVALFPILMGALVTTKDAGMAFSDWPSSDGHNMLAYPWFSSVGAKFLEHGHRLAGMLIGIVSICLATAAWRCERRAWARRMAYGVLAAVIVQGILGGQRVLQDQRVLAFLHGSLAPLVMALMVSVAAVTSRRWSDAPNEGANRPTRGLQVLAVLTATCVFVQYVLGALVRHQWIARYEHLGFAVLTALLVVYLALSAAASGIAWLRGPATFLGVMTIVQLALGVGAWVTKFGSSEYAAVYGSFVQNVFRTSHVLGGMLLFMGTVLLTMRAVRLNWLTANAARTGAAAESIRVSLPLAGGAR
ncbi:MAG: COX15/CtaA family protein [Planctomycetia bacterium]|nr:COX15/CtaA family protein [Planctomycetia bacterium]